MVHTLKIKKITPSKPNSNPTQVELSGPERETALAAFYDKFKDEPLVLLKWLGLQVGRLFWGGVQRFGQRVGGGAMGVRGGGGGGEWGEGWGCRY